LLWAAQQMSKDKEQIWQKARSEVTRFMLTLSGRELAGLKPC
jgi:hypothetical protein